MASLASTTSIDKESKNGFAPVSALKPVDSILPTVSEDAEDEAMKIVGHERNEVTEAEMKAVTKKIDRRVSRRPPLPLGDFQNPRDWVLTPYLHRSCLSWRQ